MKDWFKVLFVITIFTCIFFWCPNHDEQEIETNQPIIITTEKNLQNTPSSQIKQNDRSKIFLSPVIKINFETINEFEEPFVESIATGFSVYYDREENISYILTNNHFCISSLVSDYSNGRFFYENSRTILSALVQFESGNLKIIATDKTKDLCLMAYEGYIKPAKIAEYKYQVNQMDPVIIVGAPKNVFPVIISTYVSTFVSRDVFPANMKEGFPLILTSEITLSGQSGGPVYNEKGQVIGMIVMNFSEGTNLMYGGIVIPHQDIIDFLIKHNIKFSS